MSDDPTQRLAAIFVEEASEDLPKLGRLLLELEARPDDLGEAKVREIFRLAHTLKGSAAAVGREDLANVAHAMESVLDLLRKKKLTPGRALINALLGALDLLQKGLGGALSAEEVARAATALKQASTSPEPTTAPHAPAEPPASLPALMSQWTLIAQGDLAGTLPEVRRLLEGLGASLADRPQSKKLIEALLSASRRFSSADEMPRALAEVGLLGVDFLYADLAGAASPEELSALESMIHKALPEATPAAPAPPTAPAAEAEVAGAKPSDPAAEPTAALTESTVRIPVALLDTIVYRIDELVALKLRIDYQRRQVEDAQSGLEGFASDGGGRRSALSGVEGVRHRLELVRRDLSQEVHLLGLISQALQDDIKDIRMISLGLLLNPFRRMVRDLAFSLGKEATLEVQGENVRIDKRLLEMMRDPVMHILRNAVDHGLEKPADRAAKGKPPTGKIKIVADSRESAIWLTISDDGRGIDGAKVRAKAVERGLIEAERAAVLTERESINLVFLPGFSTVSEVTEISGRGVGLDVVAENVATLGGRIEFYSTLGEGTQFTLILPLTIAASSGLLVRRGKQLYCMPLTAVEEVIAITPADVGYSHGRLALKRRNQTLSFLPLDNLLSGQPSRRPEDDGFAIILAISDRRLAVGVDALLGQEELVVKAVASGTPHLRFVSGASNLADGRLVAVLDPIQLIEAAVTSTHTSAPLKRGERKTVLVSDDSLTSRTLVSSVLEQAGYQVILAFDGENAFQQLQEKRVDLLVSDVEMPMLDGYGLVKRVRSTPGLSTLPAILITSLAEPEDRARGAEAGASAYIVKSEFNPSSFLAMVSDLLGHSSKAST